MISRSSSCRFVSAAKWLLVLLTLAATQARGQEAASLMPSSGVLLLHNGEVIEGKISRVGDWYYVILEGGEIRIRPDRVEDHCGSLEEGYSRKRGRIREADLQDRIRLAQWCIRHNLVRYADEELTAAEAIDPRHPMLPLMRRQIAMKTAPPAVAEEESPPAVSERLKGPTLDDLDRLVRSVSPDAMETFTRTIQPLLVNRCSTGACHGAACDSKLRLYWFRPGTIPGRRTTQRNLHAAMQFIDPANPEASEILSVPSRAHGNTAVILTEQDPQYRLLQNWVRSMGTPESDAEDPSSPPERVRKPHRPPIHAMTEPGFATPPPRESAWKTPGEPEKMAPRIEDPWVANSEEPRDNGLDGPGQFTPRDPFDPEIFNRMAK